jgi:hypothetical protein
MIAQYATANRSSKMQFRLRTQATCPRDQRFDIGKLEPVQTASLEGVSDPNKLITRTISPADDRALAPHFNNSARLIQFRRVLQTSLFRHTCTALVSTMIMLAGAFLLSSLNTSLLSGAIGYLAGTIFSVYIFSHSIQNAILLDTRRSSAAKISTEAGVA